MKNESAHNWARYDLLCGNLSSILHKIRFLSEKDEGMREFKIFWTLC